jgi:4-amino-4-deoxy-L-arabinose transferase-like glycosyltransferase
MATQKITPPFAWLGAHTTIVSLIGTVGIAAFFRFLNIDTLPPALYAGSAVIGLQAAALADSFTLPGLTAANGFAPLFVWLQALPVKLLGHTELALKLMPALLGTLAVVATWLWARSWFGLRAAWLAAFLLAVTPWAVTLSRSGIEAAVYPLLTPLTLYVATRAWQQRTLGTHIALGLVLAANLLAGPVGWLIAATTVITGAIFLLRSNKLFVLDKPRLALLGSLAVGLGAVSYLVATSWSSLKSLPVVIGLAGSISALASNIVTTLLMFHSRGDENFRHNFASQPMLNAFVGLMFVAGLLVSISRLRDRRYRVLLAFFIVLMLPALITTVGAPNAGRAAAALPVILTMSAIGVSYMLELWYRTFPINSAARAVGQGAILMLLALTLFQGFTQYFRAWANTADTWAAYNEATTRVARQMAAAKPPTGTRYVVAPAPEHPIVQYLVPPTKPYKLVEAKDLAGLPITPGQYTFLITRSQKDETVKQLKLKFPGGKLQSILSDFDRTEVYYTYEVTKK